MSSSTSVSCLCNLYCNESSGDVVSSDADISGDFHESFCSFTDDDENYIVSVFDSELDHQMHGSELLAEYRRLPELVTARQEAIRWMFKVHAHYRFRPGTAHLSVNYLDRFILSHSMLFTQPGKGWEWQLLSIACLALAAKMEETSVPCLLDLQLVEPSKFFFKPKTVQRMELLVMGSLKWRLRIRTPFDFLHYFISKISCFSPPSNGFSYVFSCASDLLISTSRVIDFLDFPPSTIAAAVVLWVTNLSVDDQNLGCLHDRVNKDTVKRCYKLIRRNIDISLLPHIKVVHNSESRAHNSQ